MVSWIEMFIEGWRVILRIFGRAFKLLTACLRQWLQKRDRNQPEPRKFHDVCCIDVPWNIRARPDPFIYSQQWLMSRGLAVVWDNPDFRLIDPAGGAEVGRFDLVPGKKYRIEATIHNNSFMAAIGTNVHFDVLRFGAGTAVVDDLGTVTIDVPGAGSAIAAVDWVTPASGGHNCLRAHITHFDDANPFNNVGQHNTDIARPASPTRRLTFLVGNHGIASKQYSLTMDVYRLPARPNRSESISERSSLAYLRQLQKAQGVHAFSVPENLHAKLSQTQLMVLPGQEIEVTLEMGPLPADSGMRSVNVNVFESGQLVGGVTAYAKEE